MNIGIKFISPGGWFSLEYPAGWAEFEDTESTFLFYNPNKWCGNFRISAYKDASADYARQCIGMELKNNPTSTSVKIGKWDCAYSAETFQEEGAWYTSHIWVTGEGNLSIECSFTVAKGEARTAAEDIIRTLHVRTAEDFRRKEIIPVRVAEIALINEAFDWTSTTIKKQLSKDFTSQESDLQRIQALIDSGRFRADQRQTWECLGLAFGTIIENEMDGMEWVTVMDGKKEYPALRFKESSMIIDPANLIWEKIKLKQTCNLIEDYNHLRCEVESLLNK